MFMRRPRTVDVLVRDRVTSSAGVLAALAIVGLTIASCSPKSDDSSRPPATEAAGGSQTTPPASSSGGSSGTSGSSGASGSGAAGSGGATTLPPPGPDAAPTVTEPGPDGATGGDPLPTSDAAATGGDAAPGGFKIPAGSIAKIMVLGSSNETRTCWRAFLWQKLRAAGVMNFDYVGRTNIGPECGVAGYDKDVEAAPGTIITGFTANDFALRYKANPPDIVLVHVGGADAREGVSIPKILAAYTLAVEQARAVKPHVAFLVGLHTPQQPMTGILELNAAIPGWAAKISTPESPVGSVDLFTGIVPAMDLSDGTHLNEAGSTKVADWFLAPLLPLFKP
jgi:hypothetical protein